MATFLAVGVLPEAQPETDDGAVITTPQLTLNPIKCRLPWKAALDSSHKLTGRLGWLQFTSPRALDREVVSLHRLEKEVGRSSQGSKVIAQELLLQQSGTVGCKIL